MNKSSWVLIIVIYVVLFTSIFFYFSFNSSSFDNDGGKNQNLWEDVKESLSKIWGSIWQGVMDTDFEKPINKIGKKIEGIDITKSILPISCVVNRDFECIFFAFNNEKGEALFNLKNKMSRKIVFKGVELSEGVVCTVEDERVFHPDEEFYVKLENCEFKDEKVSLKINYYYSDSSENFMRSAQGDILIK